MQSEAGDLSPTGSEHPVFPIFVGSGRSGTTLFRNVFDSHSRLAISHEAQFIARLARRRRRYEIDGGMDHGALLADLYRNPNFVRQGLDEGALRAALHAASPPSYADAVRVIYRAYAEAQGKDLYGDKTPGDVIRLDLLGDLFPEAKFIHVVRDGRDVALSYLEREFGPRTIADAAHYWRSRVARGRASGKRLGPDRYCEVHYEEMVDDPEATTRRVCAFIGIPFEEGMLRFHEKGAEFAAKLPHPGAFKNLSRPVTKGMRDWRSAMAPEDVALFELIAGDVLVAAGYEVEDKAVSTSLRLRAASTALGWQARRVFSWLSPYVSRGSRKAPS